jgi:uncharacterized protein (DUF1800 family)
MGDDVALLLRRAGFGPTAAELAAARQAGYTGTLSTLMAPAAPDVGGSSAPLPQLGRDPLAGIASPTTAQRFAADDKRRAQTQLIIEWWLDRMTVADRQAYEKLVFFWHGHWATSVDKVIRPQLMLKQQQTLRESVNFATMAHRMVTDPALLYWLDGQLNTRTAPNENLGRELMELFMLGIGNYTETDVKAAGRALTGWKIDYDNARTYFNPPSHDRGTKTILGTTRSFDAHSLVDFLLGHEACPRFIASRLWFRYASSTLPLPTSTQEKMMSAFPDSLAMLRALFADEAFLDSRGNLVKQPVEWLVGALRQLGLRAGGFTSESLIHIINGLKRLGQVPLAPPSVGGWPAGAAWLTPGAAQARLDLAGRVAALVAEEPWNPESIANVLAVDTWTDGTYSALKSAPQPRSRLMLGLASPEYLVT